MPLAIPVMVRQHRLVAIVDTAQLRDRGTNRPTTGAGSVDEIGGKEEKSATRAPESRRIAKTGFRRREWWLMHMCV
jgi:hypothetical protein